MREGAKALGERKLPTRKSDLVALLKERLLINPGKWVEREPRAEQLAMAEIAHGGAVSADVFHAKHGMDFPKVADRWNNRPVDTVFGRIVFYDDTGNPGWDLAEELKEALAAVLPEPKAFALPGHDSPEELEGWPPPPPDAWSPQGMPRVVKATVCECAPAAPVELAGVLTLAAKGKLKLAKNGLATAASERAVQPLLVGGDFSLEDDTFESRYYGDPGPPGPVRAAAWPALLAAAKWAKASAAGALTLTTAGKPLLAGFDAMAYKEGVEKAMYSEAFDELARINQIRGQSGRGKRALTNPALRRSSIFEGLAEMPAGRWFSFEEVFRFLWANGFAFETSRDPGTLFICEAEYGRLYTGGADRKLSRLYLSAVLFETLGTLGMVDVAFTPPHEARYEFDQELGVEEPAYLSRYDGLLGVRINPLGAYCLGIADTLELAPPKTSGKFRVLPTLEIALTGGRCKPFDELRLERACVPESDHVWRLDEQTVLRSIENGQPIDEIEEGIAALSEDALPPTVASFFRDIRDRISAVVGREEAELIRLRDAKTAALLASRPDLRKICEPAGETCLAVPKKNLRAFVSRLKQHGYVLPQA